MSQKKILKEMEKKMTNDTINKIKKFREILAEQGKEVTLKEAKIIYFQGKKILKNCKKLSQYDLWNMQNEKIEGLTKKEKDDAIFLYRSVKEF